MALYCATLLLEATALLRLRWTEPDLRRPFRIPLPRGLLVVAFLPQLTLCALIVGFSMRTLPGVLLWAVILGLGLNLPSISRQCGWNEMPPPAAPGARFRREVQD